MKHPIAAVLGLSLILYASAILADMFTPSAYCSKPYKPYEFTSQYEIDSFNNDVDSYKYCIQNFVDEQNSAARKHEEAAQAAIREWNDFVNYELN